MTRAATDHRRGFLDFVLPNQIGAFDILMPGLISALVPDRGRPVHREYFRLRPNKLLRIAVTLETPFHVQRRDLISERHQIHPPVTSRAADALAHVNAVIEVNEIGQVVHSGPTNRFAGSPALANGLEIRAVSPNLRVTVHAGSGRRNSRECGFLNRGVTVAAIDAVVAYMMFVAELNRLLARKERLGVIGRPVEFQQQPENYPYEEYRAVNRELGYVVRAATKDLTHGLPSFAAELGKQRYTSTAYCFKAAVWGCF